MAKKTLRCGVRTGLHYFLSLHISVCEVSVGGLYPPVFDQISQGVVACIGVLHIQLGSRG